MGPPSPSRRVYESIERAAPVSRCVARNISVEGSGALFALFNPSCLWAGEPLGAVSGGAKQ